MVSDIVCMQSTMKACPGCSICLDLGAIFVSKSLLQMVSFILGSYATMPGLFVVSIDWEFITSLLEFCVKNDMFIKILASIYFHLIHASIEKQALKWWWWWVYSNYLIHIQNKGHIQETRYTSGWKNLLYQFKNLATHFVQSMSSFILNLHESACFCSSNTKCTCFKVFPLNCFFIMFVLMSGLVILGHCLDWFS